MFCFILTSISYNGIMNFKNNDHMEHDMIIQLNGVELFYEKVGQGKPIILLHGNGESHQIFDVLIKQLSKQYTVYAIDSRGHGKSSKVKQLDYNCMMEDIASLIKELNLESPILYGFSDGGIIGLLLASKYPDLLSKLIVSGANVTPDGLDNSILRYMRIVHFFTRSAKIKMMLTQPNISSDELQRIRIPVLVLAGEKDMIKLEHTKYIAKQIPNHQLNIINGESHGSYIVHSDKLYGIIKPFID